MPQLPLGPSSDLSMPALGFPASSGNMADLVYAKDWAATPLGPIEQWPQSLRTTVSLCLASPLPINIIWGAKRVQIYNDAYLPLCGSKHSTCLGQDYKECCPSAWDELGEAFEEALAGQTRILENQRQFLDSNGFLEETFHTLSFSPILEESGGVGGVFHPVTDVTQQTLLARRLTILRTLTERTAEAHSEQETVALLLNVFQKFDLDLPFVALYSLAQDAKHARLEGQVGLDRAGALAPATILLTGSEAGIWPLAEAARTGNPQRIEQLGAVFGAFSSGPYPEVPHTALAYSIYLRGGAQPAYFLIMGVSARRPLDAEYADFFNLLVEACTTALAKAHTLAQERQRSEALLALEDTLRDSAEDSLMKPFSAQELQSRVQAQLDTPRTRHDNSRLRTTEEDLMKFKVLSDHAFDAFILMREDGTFAYLNELARQRWGYTDEEAQHLRVLDVDPIYQEAKYREAFAEAQQRGAMPPFETLHRRKDGSTFPVEVSIGAVVLEGQPHMFAIARDITEQVAAKQQLIASEQRYRTLIEESPVATALCLGPEFRIQYASALMLSYWGKDASVLGLPLWEALPELAGQHFPALLEQVYSTGQPYVGTRQAAMLVVEGQPKTAYFTFTLKPLLNEQGKVYGIHLTALDVTQEVQALQKIEESEARFRALVEQSPVPTALTRGFDVVIESVNAPMVRMLGKQSPEEVLGKALVEVLPLAASQATLQLAKNVMTTGKPYYGNEVPVQMTGENGEAEQQYYNVSYTPLVEAGQVTGVIHVAIDVTEQVQTRHKTEGERERARLAIEVGGLGVFETNFTTLEIVADHRFNEIFGFNGPQSRERYLSVFHPDDLAERARALEAGLQSGSFAYEIRFLHAVTRQVRWVKIRGRVYRDAAGAPATVLGVAQDTTEQKTYTEALHESEQRFRIMADAAPNMVWAVNPDSSIRYINHAFVDFVGVTPEQYETTGWGPYMHPDEMAGAQATLSQAISTRTTYTLEHRMLRHDGQYRWLLAQGAPSYYPNGELYGYVGSAIDITELKHTNEQLARTNRDLDTFIYTASHDLKAPITNIEGLLTTLDYELPPDQRPGDVNLILELMHGSVERFERTIEHLTDISRLQQDHAAPWASADLHAVLEDVLLDVAPLVKETEALLEVHIPEETTLPFSAKNLRSVLYNLVSNALKYCHPNRRPQVHIRCEAVPGHYVLSVSDNGLGIQPAHKDQLFNMFKRFHTHVEGSGVGLYMVKRIVENAGGHIEVHTEPEAGSTFTLYVPS